VSKEQLQKAVVISSEAMEPALDRLTQPCSRMAPIGVARGVARRDLGTSSMEPAGVPERRRPDAPRPGPPLSIFTLGGFDIYAGHEPLRFGRKVPRKPLDLLKALIAFGGLGVAKSHLIEALWPEADGDTATQAFKTTLHRLRHVVGVAVLAHYDGRVSLNPAHCRVDCWDFERLLHRVENHECTDAVTVAVKQAVRAYKGPFLHGVEEAWALGPRERLRSRFLRVLVNHARRLQDRGQCEQAIDLLRHALEVDDLSEEYYRRLMQCYAKLGRQAEAVTVYRRCREILGRVFGLKPGPEMETLYQRILDASSEVGPGGSPIGETADGNSQSWKRVLVCR
jgi:DNA-binding SARP family transcriptional activator